MIKTIRFTPPHSIFSISDPQASDIPKGEDLPVRIWITSDMIGVACANEADGETEVSVSLRLADVKEESPHADCQLPTPSRIIVLQQSDLTEVMRFDVQNAVTRVRIWTNHPLYPDSIWIVLGG